MSIINQVSITENVAIVSFEKAKAGIEFISNLFNSIAEAGINIDMISQSAPKSEHMSVSFTINDDDLTSVLSLISKLSCNKKTLQPLISASNVKISLYGKDMPNHFGVAADVFNKLASKNIDIMLITTSEVDISIVVTQANADLAYKTLKEAYIA